MCGIGCDFGGKMCKMHPKNLGKMYKYKNTTLQGGILIMIGYFLRDLLRMTK